MYFFLLTNKKVNFLDYYILTFIYYFGIILNFYEMNYLPKVIIILFNFLNNI